MRIGISLQSLDITWGGIGVYTDEVVRNLARIDRKNEYILIYPGFGAPRKSLGRLQRKYANVTEVETDFSRFPSGFYWDQFVVPKVAREHGIDLLFNPFLSIPIPGRFKKVMIMHAVEYHTVPRVYDWKLYAKWFFLEKALLPSADRVISISNTMTNDISRAVRYPIANEAHNGLKNVRGTIAMARNAADPNSATSQFFFNLADNRALDRKGERPEDAGYCVFGEVVQGLDVLEKISQVRTASVKGFDKLPVQTVVLNSVGVVR